MKRGIATITIFVNGENNQELLNEARKVAKSINNKFDCRASVETLHDAPFGKIGSEIKQIDLSNLDHNEKL